MSRPDPSLTLNAPDNSAQVADLRRINQKLVMLLAHELGSPLTHVLGYLRLWQERAPVFERVELDLVMEQALTLKARLDEILLLDQLEAGLLELQCAPTSIQAMIADVVQAQRWRMEEKGLSFSAHIACIKPVCADPDMLRRAIEHLLENAYKFSPKRGKIELRADEVGKYCRITIADQGIGIPLEKQSRIFEPFYQVDLTHTRRYNGLGIGLKLVRAIIEKHGGCIDVASCVGEGSTFTMTIPLAQ